MKRFPYIALLVLMIATLACSMAGSGPEPTATPVPTDVPTDTPAPTDTPTPLPTSTPDAVATAAAQATASASSVLSELDKLLKDTDIPYQNGHLVWQQTDPLVISLKGPDHQAIPLDKDLSAGDFILKSDVTWKASGILICGAIFRSEPDIELGKQYQFIFLRFSGLPAWAIEVHDNGRFKNTPTKTKFSNALDLSNGSKNQFVLVVQDDNFTLYLNKSRQGKFFDYSKQRMDGSFGFMGFQDSGNGSCEFENTWIWSLD